MFDRSTFSRGIVTALGALLVAAASAGANEAPSDAAVVGGPTAGGVTALVYRHGDDHLCTALKAPMRSSGGRSTVEEVAGSCGAVPILGPFDTSSASGSSAEDDTGIRTVGVAGSDVAAVEWREHGQVVAHAATTPSPLSGAAANLRFYLLERPAKAAVDELALLDASGTVRRAEHPGDDEPPAGEPVGSARVVQRGRRGAATWTLVDQPTSLLASTPLQPERRVTQPCLRFARVGGRDSLDATVACDDPDEAAPDLLDLTDESCAPIGRVVGGVVRPAVRSLVAVLGDGTRRTVPLTAVPGSGTGSRAGVITLGTGVALRELIVYGAGDRVLDTADRGLAPVRPGNCQGVFGVSLTESIFVLGHGLGAGALQPQADDDGVLLCLAVGRAPRHPDDCGLPPVDVSDTYLRAETHRGGRYVVGLVPPEVAGARLTLDDGASRTVPAVPIPGYAGQYAQTVKVVAADVAGARPVTHFALLDARGRVLQRADGAPESPRVRHVTTLLHVPGVPPPRAGVYPAGALGLRAPLACLALGPVSYAAGGGCSSAQPNELLAKVLCAPRRIAVYGLLAHRADRLSARLAGGRDVAAKMAPLPAAIRPGGTAALLVLGAHDAPRGLVLRGPGGGHGDLTLPAAASQCGYTQSTYIAGRSAG